MNRLRMANEKIPIKYNYYFDETWVCLEKAYSQAQNWNKEYFAAIILA